jgi:DNA polymerase-3 subunit epsilon
MTQVGLSADGNHIVLHKFHGGIALPPAPASVTKQVTRLSTSTTARLLVIDTETTGLNTDTVEIIDLCLAVFTYDPASGELLSHVATHEWLQQPRLPISEEITRITGITNELVAGKQIPVAEVEALLASADLILAHNAKFDRSVMVRQFPAAAEITWGCTLNQIEWTGACGKSLGSLARDHGFFFEGHRARADVEALVKILSTDLAQLGRSAPYLAEILADLAQPRLFCALETPFSAKDAIKDRGGYFWNAIAKRWCKHLAQVDLADETAWWNSLAKAHRGSAITTGIIPSNKRFDDKFVPHLTFVKLG